MNARGGEAFPAVRGDATRAVRHCGIARRVRSQAWLCFASVAVAYGTAPGSWAGARRVLPR
eukprot:9716184-Alexandrium_andersonii.AAC.1